MQFPVLDFGLDHYASQPFNYPLKTIYLPGTYEAVFNLLLWILCSIIEHGSYIACMHSIDLV